MTVTKIHHYLALMRFDKPIGSLLLLWPTLWALWVASDGQPSPLFFWVFVLGVFVMRSAGCVINDYIDKDVDPMVARTEQRPLASGAVRPQEALVLFFLLGLMALLLLFCLPKQVWPWSIPAMAVTVIYPFMKRFMQAPQAVLGVAFCFSIPMIYVAVGREFDLAFVLLIAMNFCLVVAYDTAYAMSDREDDLKIGVKSTAILFGEYDRIAIGLLQCTVIGLMVYLKTVLGLSHLFFIAVAISAALFLYQQRLISLRDRSDCFKAFLNNGWVGAVIWLGLVAG